MPFRVDLFCTTVFLATSVAQLSNSALAIADDQASVSTTTTPSASDSARSDSPPKLALAPTEEFPKPTSTGSGAGVGRSEPVARVPNAYPAPGQSNPQFPRFLDYGSGNISISDPAEYPRIAALDWNDPTSLFDTMRPNLFNQEVEPEFDYQNIICTDRPDFTDATFSVGKGVTVLETGYTLTNIREGDGWSREQTLPETLLRYGLTDEFEIRLRTAGYIRSEQGDDSVGMRDTGIGGGDLDISAKWEVWQQDNWLPMFTLSPGTTIPSGTGGASAYELQPFCNAILGWGLRRWIYLKVGATWQTVSSNASSLQELTPGDFRYVGQRTHGHVVSQSSSLMFQLARNFGYFGEWFVLEGIDVDDTMPAHYLDTGLFWNVTPHIQFDAKVGKRLSGRVDEEFCGGGLSFRY